MILPIEKNAAFQAKNMSYKKQPASFIDNQTEPLSMS